MDDCCSIQEMIWQGYGAAADIIGDNYKFYRASSPMIPTGSFDTPGRKLDSGKKFDGSFEQFDTGDTFDGDKQFDQAVDPDLIDQTKFDADGATFDSGVDFDQPGNYLFTRKVSLNAEDMTYKRPNKYGKPTWYAVVDGTDLEVGNYFKGTGGTFFVAALQKLLPILVVECNRTIEMFRPFAQTGVGRGAYGANTGKTQTKIAQNRPCSILQGTKGEKSESGLPGDTRNPWFSVLMPYTGIELQTDDIIVDDRNSRYVLSSIELTDLGYRLTCMAALP